MSFAAEVKDFVNTMLAVRKSVDQRNSAQAKTAYYNAMIGLRRDQLNLQRENQAANRGLAGRRLAQQESQFQRRLAQNQAQFDARQKGEGAVGDFSPFASPMFGVNRTGAPTPASPGTGYQGYDPRAWDSVPGARDAQGSVSASEMEDIPLDDIEDVGENESEDDTAEMRRGGAVQRIANYANGGAVQPMPPMQGYGDEQPTQQPPQQAPQQAIPAAPPTAAGSSLLRPERDDPGERGKSKNSWGADGAEILERWQGSGKGVQDTPASNPVSLGLDALQRTLGEGMTQARVSASPGAGGTFMERLTAGAPTKQEMQAIDKVVDPNRELDPATRTLAQLDGMTNFYASRGDPQRAANAAKGLIQFGLMQSQRYGALASAAIEVGDVNRAAEYLKQAYNFIPDGRTIQPTINDNGTIDVKIMQGGRQVEEYKGITTDQVSQLAMGAASGREYINRITQIASGNFGQKATSARGQGAGQTGERQPRASSTYTNKPFNKRREEFWGEALENALTAGAVHGPSGQADTSKTPRAVILRGFKGDATKAKEYEADLGRVVDGIFRSGYNGDPRVASMFTARMATVINPNDFNALPNGISLRKTQNGFEALVDGERIPMSPEAFQKLHAMRTAAIARAGRTLEEAPNKKPADSGGVQESNTYGVHDARRYRYFNRRALDVD